MNTVCHIEFDVTDVARAQAFYKGLFGWTFRAFTDSMVVFGVGDQHIGGLQRVEAVEPGASPSVWFQVEDLDSALGRAAALGGAVVSPRQDVPNVGWSAQVADPDGNRVGLVQYA
ncbi:MAG: VOC family protein [Fimbriimonadaceae bacterium]|nr:VOC family protein [Fimbriimonadaceae bacterium]